MNVQRILQMSPIWGLHAILYGLISLVQSAGLKEVRERAENFTVPYGENEYGFWGPEGTDYPCLTSEDCMEYYNNTDPLEDAILIEEEDLGEPCIIQGHLVRSKNWYGYLAMPKLRARYGRIYYRFVYPSSMCCVKMLLYLEEQVADLRARMNCLQRQSILDPTSHQVITLSPSFDTSGCRDNRTDNGEKMIECTSGRTLRSDVDRRWYIAASSCGSPKGLDVHYSLVIYGWYGECKQNEESAASYVHNHPDIMSLILPTLCSLYFHCVPLLNSIITSFSRSLVKAPS